MSIKKDFLLWKEKKVFQLDSNVITLFEDNTLYFTSHRIPSTPSNCVCACFFLIIGKHFSLGLRSYNLTVSVSPLPEWGGLVYFGVVLLVKSVDGSSLAFHRGRKHTLPMGTACTGPESLKISVAISLPSFLPKLPCHKHAANMLIISSGSPAERGARANKRQTKSERDR